MSDLGLGKIITTEQHRDAIHVAVAPVTAAEKLYPGQSIGLTLDGRASSSYQPIGIVDPFLASPVFEGQRFWLFLFPNTVTGMRHEWQHPAFETKAPTPLSPAEDEMLRSRRWLEDFAETFDGRHGYDGTTSFNYDDLICLLRRAAKDGDEYFICNGFDMPDRAYSDRAEMWRHYEIVTGEKLTDEQKETVPFSCSC